MIALDRFTYTRKQWDNIKMVVLGELDADQIRRQEQQGRRQGRVALEVAASMYHLQSASNRRRPRREELNALRKDTESLRARIAGSLAVQVRFNNVVEPVPHPGVDTDMLTATDSYFEKLLLNLDRMIEQSGSRQDSARKTARDQFWNELLAIWRELGGKESGKAAARFLIAASTPVMASAVPTLNSVVQWLERRRSRTLRRGAR